MKEEVYNERIVKIILPLVSEESNSLTKPSERKCHFSGYVIGDGIIITCRHAFVDGGLWDKNRPIEVKYQQRKLQEISLGEATTLQALKDNNIILFESEKYDIVLLAANKLEATFNGIYLREWDKPDSWEGGGYPKYNNDELKLLDGKASSAIKGKQNLELEPRQKPHEMESWKEISGGPVFVQCDSHCQLVGIIIDYDPKLTNELKATYLKRLWEDTDPKEQKFKEILESLPFDINLPNAIRLQEYLTKNRKLIEKINKGSIDTVINLLLNKSEKELIDFCIEFKDNDGIDQLLSIALTCKYDDKEWILENEENEYINVTFRGKECAEIAMAAEDGKNPEFRLDDRGQIEASKYSIEAPPAAGIQTTAHIDIIKDLNAGKAVDKHVVQRLYIANEPDGVEFDDAEQRKLMAGYELEDADRSYYWRIKVSDHNRLAIQEVFENIKGITILNIVEDQDRLISRKEKKTFKNLPNIIKATQKHD